MGFNHFWRGRTKDFLGDMVFFQGHASPGIYARAFLEGRLSEEQLFNFRRELRGGIDGTSAFRFLSKRAEVTGAGTKVP